MARLEANLSVNSISRISAGTNIKGEIQSQCDLRIDGCFEGKITTDGRVVIGESATVKGDIFCDNLDLWGKVEGEIVVKDTLSLMDGCSVTGNIRVKKLAIELGSVFNGNCQMLTESDLKNATSVASVKEDDDK